MKIILSMLGGLVLGAMYMIYNTASISIGPLPTNAPTEGCDNFPQMCGSPLPPTRTPWPTVTLEPYPYPYPAPVAEWKTDECTVTTGRVNGLLNLRNCPGNACEVLVVLHEGDDVIILEHGSWLQVLTNDEVSGYIASKYCK